MLLAALFVALLTIEEGVLWKEDGEARRRQQRRFAATRGGYLLALPLSFVGVRRLLAGVPEV